MKIATLTETKNNLSALIDKVRHGETILVLDRGRPVARIESAVTQELDAEGRLARLERQGLLRRAPATLSLDWLHEELPVPSSGASALAFLLEEREDGR